MGVGASRSSVRVGRAGVIAAIVLGSVACARSDHPDPMFGWMLEREYGDGVPVEQQLVLDDGRVTRAELEAAAAAEVDCLRGIDGVIAADSYNWQNDVDLVGGGPRSADGADEMALEPAIEACYIDHLALVQTAWLDQEYFGGWSTENVVD